MKRFIRTKDGIYELKNNMVIENAVYYLFGKFEKTNKKHLFRNDKDLGEVVREANTIEELCDEFVLYDKTFNTYGLFDKKVITYEWLKNHLAIYKGEWFTIYGAIWTDKGLIYVAKLNEKGELELI